MSEIVVPDPERGWASAPSPYPSPVGERNPATQYFTFEEAMGRYRMIAGLKVNVTDVARRLRLTLEPGFADQLGPVDAAFFSIRRTGFAVHRYSTEPWTLLSLFRDDPKGPVEALDILLEALGVDWRAVATVAFGEGRDPLFVEPVLDNDLRPTFPDLPDGDERPSSGV